MCLKKKLSLSHHSTHHFTHTTSHTHTHTTTHTHTSQAYLEQGGRDVTSQGNQTEATTINIFLKTPMLLRLCHPVPLSLLSLMSQHTTTTITSANDLDQRHRRLAHHLNNEEIAWDEILQAMDAYIQRLTVLEGSGSKEPCLEYKILEKNGLQSFHEYRMKVGRSCR